MSISPADFSSARNDAIARFKATQQNDAAMVREATTTHAAELRDNADSANVSKESKDLVDIGGAQKAAAAANQVVASTPAPTADTGTSTVASTPVSATSTTPTPVATPAVNFDAGDPGSHLLADGTTGNTPAPTPDPNAGSTPTNGQQPPPIDPTGQPTPIPPDNSQLQQVQMLQQQHSVWNQIRNILEQMTVDDRKTTQDILNMDQAQGVSEFQSQQNNMLAWRAAGHSFAAAFIKNLVSA